MRRIGMKRIRRLPVRIRLALISASLTFAILALFAIVIGLFAARQVKSEFDDELKLTAADLQQSLPVRENRDLEALRSATAGGGAIRIVTPDGQVRGVGATVPLGPPRNGVHNVHGYHVVTRTLEDASGHPIVYLQYAKPLSRTNHTIARIDLFLAVGVLGGTALAFLAGLALARRAMSPIANLTRAARGIARVPRLLDGWPTETPGVWRGRRKQARPCARVSAQTRKTSARVAFSAAASPWRLKPSPSGSASARPRHAGVASSSPRVMAESTRARWSAVPNRAMVWAAAACATRIAASVAEPRASSSTSIA